MKRFAAFLLLCLITTLLHAQEYALGPDSRLHEGVLKGTVTKYELKPGKFYPGTPHTYSVYIPAQYNAARPTPFMIFMDGGSGQGPLGDNVNIPAVFDNLIAKHEIPPMIGIFISPGILPALSDQAQSRYERIYEYDSMNDRFARFLIEEVIPTVGSQYNLSKDPNDRALSGHSTGAIAAFMAAWNRPDQFHRVMTFIGTYMAMKGADSLPALVRKTEPKPLRVFMQDGDKDHITPDAPYGSFFAGSWPISNQIMYEALEYSGYDARFVMGNGSHDTKQAGAIMPDALRWLWRDYPNPIIVHEPRIANLDDWDPRGKVYATVSADKPWQKVDGDYKSAASPIADREGNVFFADPVAHRIYKSNSEGQVTIFKESLEDVAALSVGPDGRLYANQPSLKRIVSFGSSGDERIVARDVEAKDIVLTAKGTLYFTDPGHKTVNLIDTTGHVRIVYHGGEIALPSGVTVSPDQAMLVVADEQSRFSWFFQIAADGSLINGEPFYRLEEPDEGWMSRVSKVTEDTDGLVYFATPLGVQICEENGRMGEILNPPELGQIESLAFGGANPTWLYVTEGNRLFRRPVKVTGASVWSPTKPPTPLL